MKKMRILLPMILVGVLILVGFSCSKKATNTNESINENASAATSQTNTVLANINEDDQGEPLPAKDVIGSDLSGISRYPGSVRVTYGKDGDETSVGYETKDEVDQVQTYYKDLLEGKGYVLYAVDEYEIKFYKGGSDYYDSNDTVEIDFFYSDWQKILTYTIYHSVTKEE